MFSTLDRLAPVFQPSPVNEDDSLNWGLGVWLLAVADVVGGRRWYDLKTLHPGTFGGMTVATSGWHDTTRPGGAAEVRFNGTTDQVDFGTDFLVATNRPFSVGWWQYADSLLNDFPGVITLALTPEGTPFEVFLTSSGGYDPVSFGSAAGWTYHPATTFTVVGLWRRIDITYDGAGATTLGSWRFYLDGVPVTLTTSGGFGGLTNANRLGRLGDGGLYLHGRLDDVTVYPNRRLAATEIRDRYDRSRIGYPGLLRRRRTGLPYLAGAAPVVSDPFPAGYRRPVNTLLRM